MTKREEYIEKLAAQLKEWSSAIDEMEKKATAQSAEQKERLLKELEGLRARRKDAQVKLSQLRETTGEAWEELTDGMEKAWGEMKEAVGRVADKYKQPR
ncbi:MAG: hypothetical protein RQ748_05160 [Elusimicrobiales bacterium]|nr:hypothetical protein [Elusimicrobiales bacterium]